jgi:hypothetical protein
MGGSVLVARLSFCPREFLTAVNDALQHGDGCQHKIEVKACPQYQVRKGRQDANQKGPHDKVDCSPATLHPTDAAGAAEGFRARLDIADHDRRQGARKNQAAGQNKPVGVPEQNPEAQKVKEIRDPIQGGVEKSAENRCSVPTAGQKAIQCVGKAGNKHKKKPDDRMQEKTDRNGGGQKDADERELIRAERQAIDIWQNPFVEPPVVGLGQKTLAKRHVNISGIASDFRFSVLHLLVGQRFA